MKVKSQAFSIFLGLSTLLSTSLYLPTTDVAAETLEGVKIAQAQTTERRRIAVLDFDFSTTNSINLVNLFGGIGPAKGVSDLITNKLVDDGSYIVIERSKIEEVLKEQDFGASGRVEAATAAQIGRVLGVDAVIIGQITQFNVEENESGNGFCVFGVCQNKQKSKAIVQLNARLVSTTTGEILAAAEGLGEAKKSSKDLQVGRVYRNSKNADIDTLLSAAAEAAVTKITAEVTASASKLAALPKVVPNVEAMVADVTGNLVTLNKGNETGYKTGMNLSVERVVKEVKDPQTGKPLRTLTSPIGQIELIEVGKGFATGKITSGTNLKIGDVAKAVQ